MRRALLIKSAQDLVGDDVEVVNAVYMWHRTRSWLPFVLITAAVTFGLGLLFGFGVPNAVIIATALGAVASGASTRYFVLVRGGDTIALLTGSSVRRVARSLVRSDLTAANIKSSSNTLLATDWSIDEKIYTVPKSCEQDMQAIIA